MLPDFEYYARMSLYGEYGHDPSYILTFGIVLGVLMLFIYHNLVRDLFIGHLPDILKSRLVIYKGFDWNEYFKSRWVIVISSLIIGILTHLIWDGFTHGSEFISLVGQTFLVNDYMGMKIHEWLFWFSSIFGLIALVFVFMKLEPELVNDEMMNKKSLYWLTVFVLTMIILYIRYSQGISEFQIYIQYLVIGISSIALAILITSILFKYLLRYEY